MIFFSTILSKPQAKLLLVLLTCFHGGFAQAPKWELHTTDTRLVLAVRDNKLYVDGVTDVQQTFNYTASPSLIVFPDTVNIGLQAVATQWVYKDFNLKKSGGSFLTLRFSNASPAMELTLQFEAREGRGPVRQQTTIRNTSGERLTIRHVGSLNITAAKQSGKGRLTYISDDASFPDSTGVYHVPTDKPFFKNLAFSEGADWIPILILDNNQQSGIYMGLEWSAGSMSVQNNQLGTVLKLGLGDAFKTDLLPGETFDVPAGFIGAFNGDLDACGNSLRRYLFQNAMPEIITRDASFPKVEWNAFAATGKTPGGWDPVEAKYYPLIDAIVPLGFEEVVLDIGWWADYGDPGHIVTDTVDWPKGIPAAATYAKARGLRFGLYDNEPESFTADSGKQERFNDVAYLFSALGADFYRSDATAKPVISGAYGGLNKAHYPEDVAYWSVKGFYEVLDSLYKSVPHFSWENCAYGGGLKDYGALKRSSKIQTQDVYYPMEARKAFYDGSHVLHPMQLACVVGSWLPWKTTTPLHAKGSVYEFRSASMGAAYWHPDSPNSGNGGAVWPQQQKEEIKKAVLTYKEKLRPLIRSADLYHVFPRPDSIGWDGIEYYDPVKKKGVVYLFKPAATPDVQSVKLKGLQAEARYKLTFEDGTNKSRIMRGADLMRSGINVVLKGSLMSELMFMEKL